MNNLTFQIKNKLLSHGADLVGFGDLTSLPPDQRDGLPTGIAVAVKLPKEVVKGILDMPTKEYYDQYNAINLQLDELVEYGAKILRELGFRAVAQSRPRVSQSDIDYTTRLPHKTVATRAGIGWIGKSALLVTKNYGSAIRLSSILTDAPLETAKPQNNSLCGGCMICMTNCPAEAITGWNWSLGTPRDEIYNPWLCRETARARSWQSFGIEITLCGKCIAVCPYTQQYLNSKASGKEL